MQKLKQNSQETLKMSPTKTIAKWGIVNENLSAIKSFREKSWIFSQVKIKLFFYHSFISYLLVFKTNNFSMIQLFSNQHTSTINPCRSYYSRNWQENKKVKIEEIFPLVENYQHRHLPLSCCSFLRLFCFWILPGLLYVWN